MGHFRVVETRPRRALENLPGMPCTLSNCAVPSGARDVAYHLVPRCWPRAAELIMATCGLDELWLLELLDAVCRRVMVR